MTKKLIFTLLILIILLVGMAIALADSKPQTISITHINVSSTTGWKEYENSHYRFSFLYPKGELSDLHEEDLGQTTKKNFETISFNSIQKKKNPNIYNVRFGADAWKYNGNINDFLKNTYILNTKNARKTQIINGEYEGLRVTNIDQDEEVYYQYNFFMNDGFVYSFNLFSDDPVLIQGNQQLLDSIISTAKFY